ncbi:MAG: (Fe-S)-binding protein [Candidatus Aminicenantes bacterium]|nr:(Fe-S)-binding protein [Candidatus Aminicenantes bacterium]
MEALANQRLTLERLRKRITRRLAILVNSCVHCGLCSDSCHYYLAENSNRFIPAFRTDRLSSLFRRYHTWLGRRIPFWVGAKGVEELSIKELTDAVFGECSMCGRCAINCSVGLDIGFLIREARKILAELDQVPGGLQSTVDKAVTTGNNMAITEEELIGTLQWLEEELQQEVADRRAKIPLNKVGARVLYTLNPREPKFFPLSIIAIAKIFYAADEDWTISSTNFDATNYAYYSGDDQAARTIAGRLVEETERLGARILAVTECGHAYRSLRWEAPNWLGKRFDFQVKSILELIADYIRQGRIRLDSSIHSAPVTLHDPCNLVRYGGVMEVQRYILRKAVSNFVEMHPNRERNYCCGGGGGLLSMSEYAELRLKAGKAKAEQIRRTGAKVVAAPCHNCIDQLMELNKKYKLGIETKTIGEIVADALILPSRRVNPASDTPSKKR